MKLRLKTHHKLDSNDSEEYLSICCRLHTLQKSIEDHTMLKLQGVIILTSISQTQYVGRYHLDETFWRQIALLEVYLDIPL